MARRQRPRKKKTARRRVPDRKKKTARRRALDPERTLAALSRQPVPATRLLRRLGQDRSALRSLRKLLGRLEAEGRAERVSGGWRRPRPDGLVEAEFVSAGGRGGGSARDDAGREWRVAEAEGARPGDRLLVAPRPRGRAQVLEVIPAERDHWVGILRRHGKLSGIGPYRDEGDWFVRVARGDEGGAEPGEVVRAVPAERKGRRRGSREEPWARITERLGLPGEPDADFAALVWRHRLPREFPEAADREAEAAQMPRRRERGRADLRALPFLTIDPASARDHDDAVCVERKGQGWRLHVAIADVAHFVAPGTALDREARHRGNSFYFPDRSIPMLPERLSAGLCSLVPGEDRLAMVVELDVDAHGELGRRRFRPATIRSVARLSYAEAAACIEDGDDSLETAPMLRELGRLAERLRHRRLEAGSLDFELPQVRFRFDRRGHPVDARPEPRTAAHRTIEEAMLLANRAVAERLVEAEVAAVHRIHEPPAPDDLERLLAELTALGLFEGGSPESLSARALARALARASGTPGERWIHNLALRSMRRARYSADSQPHFALGFERYLHFTSPIRRYADLVVHRALKALLDGEDAGSRSAAEGAALRCSYRERVAVSAEREMSQLKACVLLRDHLGEVHEGSITGLAGHGLYVTLDAWWVEGLVHVSRLRGHYELEESGKALVGPGRRYALGDRVEVEIAAADPVAGRIDFELARERGRDAAARPARARSRSESRSQRAGKRTKRPSRVRKRR